VGHSTRERGELAALLHEHGVRTVADVRRFPRSRRHPQFDAGALAAWLPEEGIAYVPLPELGGRRSRVPESPNGGWEHPAFQAYADWMAGPEFAAGIARLEALAAPAVMCAEAQWWRCHRRLVADALVVRGHPVGHIIGAGREFAHELTPFAVVNGTRITYPASQLAL
jgi:uncharacterized protein (DUF488 family)